MKVLFCGGGTAGHVYPAIAMAEILQHKYPKLTVHFIGRCGGDENKAITDAGFPLTVLNVQGLSRRSVKKSAESAIAALRAVSIAKKFLREYNPDVVIGTGGYVCYPVFSAAVRLGIPCLMHESNATPGLVTRLFAKRCRSVMLGFSRCAGELPRGTRCIYTGNPTRRAFTAITKPMARRILGIPDSEFLVVSFGGSLGAEAINNAVAEYMSKPHHGTTVIHATGKRYYDNIAKKHPDLTKKQGSRILPYIENMPLYLSAADIAITRSGAMTLAELAVTGTPAILIPSPNVSGNHQYKNAEAECRSGRSMLLPEKELTAEALSAAILEMRKRRYSAPPRVGKSPSVEVADKILKAITPYVKI